MDRNHEADISARREARSLSARRAWIEIFERPAFQGRYRVALRKESVDRNMISSLKKIFAEPSLSARRAWIEIMPKPGKVKEVESLSARRAWIEIM